MTPAVVTTLVVAIVSMLLAATLYTLAVFAERRAGALRPVHLALFWAGLVFDVTGTTLMSRLAAGGWQPDLHGILGAAAIALMLLHSVWASVALAVSRRGALANFHRFSIVVWALWMVAFVSGFLLVAITTM